jgi:hypothetical protein
MKTVGARQRVLSGKRLGERGDRFAGQAEDRPVAVFRSGCGSASSSSQVRPEKRRTRSLADSSRPGEFLAGEGAALAGVRSEAPERLAVPGLTSQAPVPGPERAGFRPRDQDHVLGVCGHMNSSPSPGASATITRTVPPLSPARIWVSSL